MQVFGRAVLWHAYNQRATCTVPPVSGEEHVIIATATVVQNIDVGLGWLAQAVPTMVGSIQRVWLCPCALQASATENTRGIALPDYVVLYSCSLELCCLVRVRA